MGRIRSKFKNMPMKRSKFDGRYKRRIICQVLEWEDFVEGIKALYLEGMSGVEISEYLYRETEVELSPRSIQRVLQAEGIMRPIGEAFRNAMARGRVIWQLEEDKKRRKKARQLNKGLRYKILKRDNFRCQICGISGVEGGLLQVDHIIAQCNGGGDEMDNLRTLCLKCNIGKREVEKEAGFGGGFKSGS